MGAGRSTRNALGPDRGVFLRLVVTVFGRDAQCDVVLHDDACSWRHASTSSTPEGTRLRDLDSTNGTFLNGERIRSAILREGDEVRMGDLYFRFVSGQLTRVGAGITPARSGPQRFRMLGLLVLAFAGISGGAFGAFQVLESRGGDRLELGEEPAEESSSAPSDLFAAPSDLGRLVEIASSSVVSVTCGGSSGSGWPITIGSDVVVVTNHHVIESCLRSGVRVSTSAASATETVLASDPLSDLAVLSAPDSLVPFETAEPPPVGAWLMLVGNPLGLERSVSYGTLNNYADGLIITDAAINPGNSGGPAFDSLGRVVGTASAKVSSDGVDRVGIVIGVRELCMAVLDCGEGLPG